MRSRTLLVLGAVSVLPALATDLYLPALPQLSRDLGTSPSAAQLTLTAVLAGLAVGQFLTGPLSDRFGRRRPLVAGLAVFAASSLASAATSSISALIASRLVQGLSGGAAVVVVQAMVRDGADTRSSARTFARLLLIGGATPILAPVLGAQLLRVTRWPGLFVVIAGLGVVLLALSIWSLPETLPLTDRGRGGLAQMLRSLGLVVRDAQFCYCVAVGGAGLGAMFAYIAASPFVLQDIYGISQQQYSAVFAVNAAGLIALSQVSSRLAHTAGPSVLLRVGAVLAAAGGLLLLYAGVTQAPLAVVLVAFFAIVASVGLTAPNATALALARHGDRAGSAAALIGLLNFALGAIAGPLTGMAGPATAVPLGIVVSVLTCVAAGVAVRLVRAER